MDIMAPRSIAAPIRNTPVSTPAHFSPRNRLLSSTGTDWELEDLRTRIED